ncbi:hypothetical protein PP657_gp068 [Bacillus phage BCPST]|uniref:Uncharacterized protein n=1 Tax=Bacillus phage BCPST TaxID=2801506 RepID=A0AAE7P3K2_9CAUD|nr:hypothetical protein PP657_gp068 [Bacillus phage BCPST]QQO38686.1 hypothetical protein BCPST_068 [Bacillus phage BCPST]QSJ04278.1 hypothetical protein BCP6_073 [Bacillus phage BCP6]
MSDVTTVVVKVDEQGNIINSMSGTNIGLSADNPIEYDLIINKVPSQQAFEIRKYKVVMEGFKPKLVLKDGETPPVIPEPELTLAQKVELLEKELVKEKQANADFRDVSQMYLDFLSEEIFKTQMMKEGM